MCSTIMSCALHSTACRRPDALLASLLDTALGATALGCVMRYQLLFSRPPGGYRVVTRSTAPSEDTAVPATPSWVKMHVSPPSSPPRCTAQPHPRRAPHAS